MAARPHNLADDVLHRVFALYGRRLWALLLPSLALNGLLAWLDFGEGAGWQAAVTVSGLVLGGLYAGYVAALVDGGEGPGVSPMTAVRRLGPVLVPLLAVAVLSSVGVVLGLLALVVPGLILMTIWAVSIPAVVDERLGVRAAFARSRTLARRATRIVFGLALINLMLRLGVLRSLSEMRPEVSQTTLLLVDWLAFALISPYVALVVAVLFRALQAPTLETSRFPRASPSRTG